MGPVNPDTPSPAGRDNLGLPYPTSNPQSPDGYYNTRTPPSTTSTTTPASTNTTSHVTRRLSPQVKSSICSSDDVKPKLINLSSSSSSTFSSPTTTTANSTTMWTNRRRKKYHGGRRSATTPYTYIWIVAWILSVVCFTAVGLYKRRKQNNKNAPVSSSLRTLSVHPQQQQQQDPREITSPPIEWEFTDVVHIIQTRLMQSQPDLIDLGMARLQIFKHFCLPSMQHQTSQNFLWIIRTDPKLDPRLKQILLDLVRPFPHFVVVASNHNPEGFRSHHAIADIFNQTWSGNLDLALQFHKAAQSRVVLESRLDADDGLHKSFVEYIQQDASYFLVNDDETETNNKTVAHHPSKEENKWMVWCTRSHVEWQYSSPFSKTDENAPHGYLVGIKRKDCVTPGVTMGFGIGTTRGQLPAWDHTKLHKVIPKCSSERQTHCLFRYAEKYPGAVRARTVTSAGMNRVVIGMYGDRRMYVHAKKQKHQQESMWDGLFREFHITRQDAAATRSYIGDHLAKIAEDNLKGQCTRGHSCKAASKKILKQMREDPKRAIGARESR